MLLCKLCLSLAAGDLLADIMKADPEDTVMSDGSNENSFALANHGDSPDWMNRPLIQATQLQDNATHDISNDGPEEGEYTNLHEQGMSSGATLFPATTAEGGVFYMEDTPRPSSAADHAGPTGSDASMAAASLGQSANVGDVETGHGPSGDVGTASSFLMDESPMDVGHGTPATGDASTAEGRFAAEHVLGGESRAGAYGLPESLGSEVGDEAADDADADSNEANDGDTSEAGSLQELSDDDFPKKTEEPDISADYQSVV